MTDDNIDDNIDDNMDLDGILKHMNNKKNDEQNEQNEQNEQKEQNEKQKLNIATEILKRQNNSSKTLFESKSNAIKRRKTNELLNESNDKKMSFTLSIKQDTPIVLSKDYYTLITLQLSPLEPLSFTDRRRYILTFDTARVYNLCNKQKVNYSFNKQLKLIPSYAIVTILFSMGHGSPKTVYNGQRDQIKKLSCNIWDTLVELYKSCNGEQFSPEADFAYVYTKSKSDPALQDVKTIATNYSYNPHTKSFEWIEVFKDSDIFDQPIKLSPGFCNIQIELNKSSELELGYIIEKKFTSFPHKIQLAQWYLDSLSTVYLWKFYAKCDPVILNSSNNNNEISCQLKVSYLDVESMEECMFGWVQKLQISNNIVSSINYKEMNLNYGFLLLTSFRNDALNIKTKFDNDEFIDHNYIKTIISRINSIVAKVLNTTFARDDVNFKRSLQKILDVTSKKYSITSYKGLFGTLGIDYDHSIDYTSQIIMDNNKEEDIKNNKTTNNML